MPIPRSFKLPDGFIAQYAAKEPQFGFGLVGELTYRRTYARPVKGTQRNEEWHETIQRVVEGTFSILKWHCEENGVEYSSEKIESRARNMYDAFFNMRCLPPGRGLWAMGSDIVHRKQLGGALQNCAFVSTAKIGEPGADPAYPFTFLMDASMLGVGVGFDTKGRGCVRVVYPFTSLVNVHVVKDSREGWVDSVRQLLRSWLRPLKTSEFADAAAAPQSTVSFDYSQVRPEGTPLTTFGGFASGPAPLVALHENIVASLESLDGEPITSRAIVDIMNHIGCTVVAGNVRRSAEISFGDPHDAEFLDLKNYAENPERAAYGWASNNSVLATPQTDYADIADRIRVNGEPGLAWLDNMRKYGRLCDPADYRDYRVAGGNPCLEQSLESEELCNLNENFIARHETLEDFLRTLEISFMYSKIVTLVPTHWERTNEIMSRNRRIGSSMTGLAQFLARRPLEELRDWSDTGYQHLRDFDRRLSRWLAVPESIKITSVKPSGSVSLLAGATPGMHWPMSRHYIRRITLAQTSPLVAPIAEAGYHVERSEYDPTTSCVVEMPVRIEEPIRTTEEISMWQQLAMAAFLQRWWADNQVSVTVTFDPETEGRDLAAAIEHYQYHLKGVSFLPRVEMGAYAQMPYESIDSERYDALTRTIARKINWNVTPRTLSAEARARLNFEYTAGGGDANSQAGDAAATSDGQVVDAALPSDVMFCDSDYCVMGLKK